MKLHNLSLRQEIPSTLGNNSGEGITCVFLKYSTSGNSLNDTLNKYFCFLTHSRVHRVCITLLLMPHSLLCLLSFKQLPHPSRQLSACMSQCRMESNTTRDTGLKELQERWVTPRVTLLAADDSNCCTARGTRAAAVCTSSIHTLRAFALLFCNPLALC